MNEPENSRSAGGDVVWRRLKPTKHRDLPSDRDTRDLLSMVASRTFGAVVAGMMLYTLVEYLIYRPTDLPVFVTHHVLHVAVIGMAVWIVSAILIVRLVIKPVEIVFLHLRKVAAGRLDYLDIEAGSTQLGDMVGSVNELVAQLRRTPEEDSLSRALDRVQELRAAIRERMEGSPDEGLAIMRVMTKLEGNLLEVMHEHAATPGTSRNVRKPALPSS